MKNISPKVFAFVPVVRGANRLEVKNSGDEHEIVLMGTIGKSYWDDSGVSEKEFRDALGSIPKGKKLTIRINSEGGSVKEGLGIYNAIKDRRSDITCRIDGYALSIASVFPLAAGKVISPKSAIWMMHKAWSCSQGNSDDMEAAATMLKEHDKVLAEIYVEETGKTLEEIEAAMSAETWVRGSAAVEFGLADETGDEDEENANASYRPFHPDFISRCKNLSPEILNAISAPKQAAKTQQQQTKEPTVNKEQKLALLKSWGVEASISMEETALDKLIEAGKPQAKKQEPENVTQLAKIQAQLDRERKSRIENQFRQAVVDQKITNDECEFYVSAALVSEEAEAKITKLIAGKQPSLAGSDPVNFSRVTVVDGVDFGTLGGRKSNELVNIHKEHKTVTARYQAKKENWKQILDAACTRDLREGREVFASNTYSATLVTSFLMDGSVTDLQNIWAPLKAFSMDFTQDPYKPLATGVLKHVTAGAATQTDATDFESGNSTVAPVSVTMHQYSQSFQVSNSDLNSGLRMEDLVKINTANFANKVIEVATAPITAAIFTATPLISAAAAFGFSDLAQLQGQLKKSPIKNLILDGAYIARIANTPGFFQQTGLVGGNTGAWKAFGWDVIAQNTDWTGAGANIVGFACNPQAIAGITGLPLTPPNIPGGIFSTTTATVPGLEASVMLSTWFNPKTRTMWSGMDIMAGFKEVDTTAGIVIASGTPS